MKRNLSVGLIAIALLAASCSRIGSRSDAQVASDVQNKITGTAVSRTSNSTSTPITES